MIQRVAPAQRVLARYVWSRRLGANSGAEMLTVEAGRPERADMLKC
jgi:hypothetical protein